MSKIIYSFLTVIFFYTTITAQTETRIDWLKNFSSEYENLWRTEKAYAESIAVHNGFPVWFEYADGSVIELQRIDENGIPVYHATDNIVAANTISSSQVWTTGIGGFMLDGSGQTLGLWEAGGYPLNNHQELTGRVFQMDAGSGVTQHATHVAGTMIASGVNAGAKGMSSNGTINYYNSSGDLGEVSAAASNGLKVSNHSYGQIRGFRFNYFNDNKWAWFGDPAISETEDWQFGFYNSTSASWDNMLFNAPNMLVVKSAGNDRGDGPNPGAEHWALIGGSWQLTSTTRDRDGGIDGFDCINDPRGIAKNTLTIGAVNDIPGGYVHPGDVQMSSFSNWGPTDDGRIKPDVVGNGISLNSSSNQSPSSYASLSGTSMSTPNISGSVGLLLQHQQNLHGSGNVLRAATIKGIIIHTADEAGNSAGPDYTFGWGLMNTLTAVKVLTLDSEVGGSTLVKEEILQQGGVFEYSVTSVGNEPLKVTVSWTDHPGQPVAPSLNPPDAMLVNDLDLRVIGPGGTFLPWILDPNNPSAPATMGDNFRDNVEQVLIENPLPGNYTVRVTHKGTLQGGSQAFSIITTGLGLQTPDVVSLISPQNNATSVVINPLFEWSRSPRGYDYQIQIAEDIQFTVIVHDVISKGIKFQSPELLGMKTYYWRVRGVNSGGTGNWSDVYSFTTVLVPPPAPVLVFPEDFSENQELDLDFVWREAHSAQFYRLQVSVNLLFNQPVFDDSTLTDTTASVTGLADGVRYYWRVNAKNSQGFGGYIGVRRFITRLSAPSNLTGNYNPPGEISLLWDDNSSNETKYYIMRKTGSNNFSIIDSLGANSTTYTDQNVQPGNEYTYRVYCSNSLAVSAYSNEHFVSTIVSVDNVLSGIPDDYIVYQNYPNPFNPVTKFRYGLPSESSVKISVYNILGEVVAVAENSVKPAGFHEAVFAPGDLSSGVYFFRIDASSLEGDRSFQTVQKMILMK